MKTLRLFLALLCSFGFGCSVSPAENEMEHAADAGMQRSASLTVYTVEEGNTVTAVQKRLPWQSDMAAYTLSFALPDADTEYAVAIADGQATVDISRFPTYTSAEAENAAVAAVVNTMLSYPGVDSVYLHFDGRVIETLPCGTSVDCNFISLYCINITSHP